jgi:hypothetical protein
LANHTQRAKIDGWREFATLARLTAAQQKDI